MSTRVSVRHDPAGGGVIAVKSAATPDEIAALAREAARLDQASHPGVVALVDHRTGEGEAELHTRFAGEPLDRWRGTLPRLAGLGAAVAATLADLHQIGVVHGRIDASHVLVGDDGRPRLCGFSPADDSEPADDVAALGRLLADLLPQTRPSARHGTIIWRRGPLAEQRAFEQVLDHACHEVAGRRPSAQAFAAALLAAVPGAELPPSGDASSPTADDGAADQVSIFGAGANALSEDGDVGLETPDHQDDEPAVDGEGDEPAGDDVGSDDPTTPGWSPFDDVFGDQTDVGLDDVFADRPWSGRRLGHRRRSPRPAPESPRRNPGRLVVVALIAAAAVAGVVLWTGHRPDVDRSPEAASPQGPAAGESPEPCPTVPAVPSPATGTGGTVDVDGDGCPDDVRIHAGVVYAAGDRWAVGGPDDQVAVGDWDCDGQATPALYRPTTGDVFVFPTWAAPGEPLTVEAVAQVSGGEALTVETGATGDCDVPLVELAGGEQHVVDLSAAEGAGGEAG